MKSCPDANIQTLATTFGMPGDALRAVTLLMVIIRNNSFSAHDPFERVQSAERSLQPLIARVRHADQDR
jgi:hypothetical protein